MSIARLSRSIAKFLLSPLMHSPDSACALPLKESDVRYLRTLSLPLHVRVLLALRNHQKALELLNARSRELPKELDSLKAIACMAAACNDWPSSLALWKTVADIDPISAEARVGIARASIHLHDMKGVESDLRQLALQYPSRSDVVETLLDALWTNNDLYGVVEVSQKLWRMSGSKVAARRLVASLARLGRTDEAESAIQEIEDSGTERGFVANLKVTLYRDSRQWNRLADHLRNQRLQSPTNLGSTADEIECLMTLGRSADLRELLEVSPPRAKALTNSNVRLAIAQVFGRSKVREHLIPLLHEPHFRGLDSNSLHCAIAASDEHDQDLLSAALTGIERQPQHCTDRRLSLTLPFAKVFRASLRGLRGTGPWPPPSDGLEEHLRKMIEVAETRTGGETRLLEYVDRISARRAAGDRIHMYTSCSIADALAVADTIVEAVREKQPLSVIRLGDGEGGFLLGHTRFDEIRPCDQFHFFRVWWNQVPSVDEIRFLEEELAESVANADIVGIPNLEILARNVGNLSDERLALPASRMMRGYVNVLETLLIKDNEPNPRMLTSSHFHQDFITWRLWAPILRIAESCSLITCHAELPIYIERTFGRQVRHTYLLPPEAKWSDAFADPVSGRHFPERFNELMHELDVIPGELHLVAAGVLGKLYCDRIKSTGGIAIDIGAVADYWCGYRTRYSISALQVITPASEEDLIRLAAKDSQVRRIMGTG